MGLVNHVCPDDEVLDQAMACAHRIAKLPRRAVEDTKRILNLHLERAVLATLDFALSRRGPVVHLAGAAGQPRPPPARPATTGLLTAAGVRLVVWIQCSLRGHTPFADGYRCPHQGTGRIRPMTESE